MGIDLVEHWLREHFAANPYQRPGGAAFHRSVHLGCGLFLLPITPRWGIKAFHNEDRDSHAKRASGTYLLAHDNRLIQAEIQKRGLAPRSGPARQAFSFGNCVQRLLDGDCPTDFSRAVSERTQESERGFLELGLADLDHPKNAGLIDDRFVVVDFSIVQDGESYLGSEEPWHLRRLDRIAEPLAEPSRAVRAKAEKSPLNRSLVTR